MALITGSESLAPSFHCLYRHSQRAAHSLLYVCAGSRQQASVLVPLCVVFECRYADMKPITILSLCETLHSVCTLVDALPGWEGTFQVASESRTRGSVGYVRYALG